ncbi:VOC family protein [Conexibacter arvalis]|uniref:Catechol 2,3-dioxygenase-like lactoylglutathione lyase family enzyme n=1 Tax=Conexibacter arvalis TaxID=912552 RepID=A0A840IMB1_9ACTN|nr:VOC family protein [Conexibacter arvalis]MBB4665000.1 catechol 2,3-dioxygenase-like lactoylglutathione lyase family enzyme [Conexibacter arvalis]
MVTIEELTVADEPGAWAALGFAVDGDRCRIGAVDLRLAGRAAGRGLVSWTLRGLADAAGDRGLDGLATVRADGRDAGVVGAAPSGDGGPSAGGVATAGAGSPAAGAARSGERAAADRPAAPAHANGVEAIDHVVVISPALDRTIAAFEAAGLGLRRVREQPTPTGAPRQAFFRLGAEIVEVVQEPAEVVARSGDAERPAIFWGLALRCADLDAAVADLGDRVSPIRDAVQPGRRIASLRRAAGLALPIALMTP